MNQKSFGGKMKERRKAMKLTQEKLAEKVGLSTNYIGVLERGEKTPKIETLINLANVLETTIDVLLSDDLHYYNAEDFLRINGLKALTKDSVEHICNVVKMLVEHELRRCDY